MGAIRRAEATPARVEYLYPSHTVGRAPRCELVIARRAISGHHATIRWADGVWTLRDLGSRNGTFLNGRRLAGSPRDLAEGDRLTFGEGDEVWELVDASEPASRLVPVESGLESGDPPLRLDRRDVLALPSAEDPRWTIYRRQDQWLLEQDTECVVLVDRQEIVVGDRRFRVMLIDDSLAATDANAAPVERRVEDLMLEIQVSPDEESAAVRVQLGAEVHELPQRAFFYLLAFLARRRLEEAEREAPDAGWVDVPTACRELGLSTPQALGLLVHRCRKAMQICELEDPAAIVDRSRKGRLRVGIEADRLLVTRLR